MTNPLVHALIFTLAVIIPGGLIAYFAWRAYKAKEASEAKAAYDKELAPHEVKQAFLRAYPRESLRARSRRERLDAFKLAKTRPRKKSQ
jgi:hypothetical protein